MFCKNFKKTFVSLLILIFFIQSNSLLFVSSYSDVSKFALRGICTGSCGNNTQDFLKKDLKGIEWTQKAIKSASSGEGNKNLMEILSQSISVFGDLKEQIGGDKKIADLLENSINLLKWLKGDFKVGNVVKGRFENVVRKNSFVKPKPLCVFDISNECVNADSEESFEKHIRDLYNIEGIEIVFVVSKDQYAGLAKKLNSLTNDNYKIRDKNIFFALRAADILHNQAYLTSDLLNGITEQVYSETTQLKYIIFDTLNQNINIQFCLENGLYPIICKGESFSEYAYNEEESFRNVFLKELRGIKSENFKKITIVFPESFMNYSQGINSQLEWARNTLSKEFNVAKSVQEIRFQYFFSTLSNRVQMIKICPDLDGIFTKIENLESYDFKKPLISAGYVDVPQISSIFQEVNKLSDCNNSAVLENQENYDGNLIDKFYVLAVTRGILHNLNLILSENNNVKSSSTGVEILLDEQLVNYKIGCCS